MRLDDSERLDGIGIAHAIGFPDPRTGVRVSEPDNELLTCRPKDVNVGRPMLARRDVDDDPKSMVSQDRGQGEINPTLGFMPIGADDALRAVPQPTPHRHRPVTTGQQKGPPCVDGPSSLTYRYASIRAAHPHPPLSSKVQVTGMCGSRLSRTLQYFVTASSMARSACCRSTSAAMMR